MTIGPVADELSTSHEKCELPMIKIHSTVYNWWKNVILTLILVRILQGSFDRDV